MVADAYVRRTAITRISVSAEQRDRLESTITEWKRGCQIAVNEAWQRCHAKSDVQPLAYDAIRERTALGSQHAVLATHRAADALTGCKERRDAGKETSKPRFSSPTVTYDSRSMTLFDDGTVSLATTGSRVRCELVLPEEADGYQRSFLNDDRWRPTESTLTVRDGSFFLHIGFRREIAEPTSPAEDGTVLGVDLGVENVAVTSTGRFFDGGALRHRLREFERTRAGLQRTGTRSAHRTMARASGRERRHLRDVLHRVSRAIVHEALRYDCDIIAFENLSGIRERTDAAWGHRWAFRNLQQYVEYKARAVAVVVEQVDPRHTSKRCSECGHVDSKHRQTRNEFCCLECNSTANADYNAAKNIGLRYVRRGQQSSRRTGNGQLALKSGTVTPNGGFTAYPSGFEAEFTDKFDGRQATSVD